MIRMSFNLVVISDREVPIYCDLFGFRACILRMNRSMVSVSFLQDSVTRFDPEIRLLCVARWFIWKNIRRNAWLDSANLPLLSFCCIHYFNVSILERYIAQVNHFSNSSNRFKNFVPLSEGEMHVLISSTPSVAIPGCVNSTFKVKMSFTYRSSLDQAVLKRLFTEG